MIDKILTKLESLDKKGICYTFKATYQRINSHKAQPVYELKLENKDFITITLSTCEFDTLKAVLKLVEDSDGT